MIPCCDGWVPGVCIAGADIKEMKDKSCEYKETNYTW
jgi:hypothetical protein